jgi:hypothetical protein
VINLFTELLLFKQNMSDFRLRFLAYNNCMGKFLEIFFWHVGADFYSSLAHINTDTHFCRFLYLKPDLIQFLTPDFARAEPEKGEAGGCHDPSPRGPQVPLKQIKSQK